MRNGDVLYPIPLPVAGIDDGGIRGGSHTIAIRDVVSVSDQWQTLSES